MLSQINPRPEAAALHVASLKIRSKPAGHSLAPLLPSTYAESAQRTTTVDGRNGEFRGENWDFRAGGKVGPGSWNMEPGGKVGRGRLYMVL